MADFYYKFGNLSSEFPRFGKYYTQKINVDDYLNVFYNQGTVLSVENEIGSIFLLGYAHVHARTTESFLWQMLREFDTTQIAEIKKLLMGQYLVILRKNGFIYLFSDFLQTRNIYYDRDEKRVSSSFDALYVSVGAKCNNNYKAFEYLSMRHCLYPVWLGNNTISDNIQRMSAFEYLTIHVGSGEMEVCRLNFDIKNQKVKSLKKLVSYCGETLRKAIFHPEYKNKKVYTTITGGFDSRLVTAFVKEYYTDVDLRISSQKNIESLDIKIASRIAETLSSSLKIYETNPEKQKSAYYSLTEGLSPQENIIMTELFQSKERGDLGFGGVFGTELYTIVAYDTCDDLIHDYVKRARKFVKADETYYKMFELALYEEFENIRSCYSFQVSDERDLMRIFQLLNTGRFSSQFVSALHMNSNQYEVLGTFPVIEAGLRIPYKYLGSKWTFGRYYLIPKYLMKQTNQKIARITTNHFCPMVPLSLSSFGLYVRGKFEQKQYEKEQFEAVSSVKTMTLQTPNFSYSSNDWFEGFVLKYFGH